MAGWGFSHAFGGWERVDGGGDGEVGEAEGAVGADFLGEGFGDLVLGFFFDFLVGCWGLVGGE